MESVFVPGDSLVEDERFEESQNGSGGYRRATQVLLTSLPLVVSDLVALVGANLLARSVILFSGHSELELTLLTLSGIFVVINTIFGLYPGTGLNPVVELRQTTIATILLYAAFMASSPLQEEGSAFMLLLGVASLFTMLFVPLLRSIIRKCFSRFSWWGQPALIFGNDNSAQFYFEMLNSNPRLGLRPVVVVDDHQLPLNGGTHKDVPNNGFERARSMRRIHDVSCAIITMPNWEGSEILTKYNGSLHQVVAVPERVDLPSVGNRMCDWAALDGFCIREKPLIKSRIIKRAMDIFVVLIVGLFILPLVAVIALLIKINSPGPVIYAQQRIGHNGRRFWAWKFRTMVVNADEVLKQYLAADPLLRQEWKENHKLKKDPRVTRIGRLLRKTSLDELPQLWNVLLGEMTLVGPRPIVKAEISKYGKSFALYAKVVPGITGLWQISGRNNTTYAERIRLDNYYVRNWSFWLDIYILARTIKVVFCSEGAY